MASVGIINCGLGNLTSVQNAFLSIRQECDVIDTPSHIEDCDRLVLPGVGAFPSAMEKLQSGEFVDPICHHINAGKPFLGICMGMQVLFETGEENGTTPGLGLLKGTVVKLPEGKQPIPNMGWWDVFGDLDQFSDALTDKDSFYFVHSYHCALQASYSRLSIEFNNLDVTVGVRHDNILGCQFHPEKSQKSGQKILTEFLRM